MRTGCTNCGKEFAAPETALQHHIKEHEKVNRVVGGIINGRFVKKWPLDTPFLYVDGQAWGDYGAPCPPNHA